MVHSKGSDGREENVSDKENSKPSVNGVNSIKDFGALLNKKTPKGSMSSSKRTPLCTLGSESTPASDTVSRAGPRTTTRNPLKTLRSSGKVTK